MRQCYWNTTVSSVKQMSISFNYNQVLDVAIIGGGFAGINAALYLANHKLKVALIDKGSLGSGASTFNAGFVSNFPLKATNPLISYPTRYMCNFHKEALIYLKKIIEQNRINCELNKSGLIFLVNTWPENYNNYALLQELKDESDIKGFKYGLFKEDSYTLNPYKYLQGLVSALILNGVGILEHSPVTHISKHENFYELKIQDTVELIKAKKLIVATGTGELTNAEFRTYQNSLYPIESGIIVTEPLKDEQILKVTKYKRAFITEGKFINYFRITEDNRLLFGGKQTLAHNHDKSNYEYLISKITNYFPFLENIKIDFHWQKTLMFNATGVPIVKKINKNLFYINGFCGSGIANASYSGYIIGNAIITSSDSHPIFSIKHPQIPKFLNGNLIRKLISLIL